MILTMTVLHRLDAVLQSAKNKVSGMKAILDSEGAVDQDSALRQAVGQDSCNASLFTLWELRSRASRQQPEAEFRDWLDGFSPRVRDILDRIMSNINNAVSKNQCQIDLVRELRTRLFANVVTGRFDVLKAAPTLDAGLLTEESEGQAPHSATNSVVSYRGAAKEAN